MTYRIAVAGKGGTGKTTMAALIVRELLAGKKTPVLAVDADPNSNLNEALGIGYDSTIAELREEMPGKELPSGTSKGDYINRKLQEAVAESRGFDLLVMGRPEGRGCYCFINELLRGYLSNLAKQYRYVVMDNEAGMEHLSRRTTDEVDLLLITSDQTLVGLRSAARVAEVARKVKLKIKKTYLVISRAKSELSEMQKEEARKTGLELLEIIPEDDMIDSHREGGKSLFGLPEESAAVSAVKKLLAKAGVI